jgi:ATP-binding cassette subfamily C protein LapB
VDIRQIDVSELRHNIGYVAQDIQLLAGTLRDNLVSGARYVDDEMVLQAAELAGVHEFARLHPQGYELQVGERGQNLSGGQRQNVALARALLLNPPILLLDEPTSAMDNTGEERLKQRLQSVIENKTVILVTHRASLLPGGPPAGDRPWPDTRRRPESRRHGSAEKGADQCCLNPAHAA